MKIFKKMKDGGSESTVTGYWLIECKSLFSVVLLKFEGKSREAYHTHAFNCFSWVIKGHLTENVLLTAGNYSVGRPASFKPFVTKRTRFHKVDSTGTTWVLSFRGKWSDRWQEYNPKTNKFTTLTNRRKDVG